MKRQIMLRAWEIVRTLEGDLKARLSVALKQAWAESRVQELTVHDIKYLIQDALQDEYSRVLVYEGYQKDFAELTVKSIEYKRGRRNETVISRVQFSVNGDIKVYDRTSLINDVLKNTKVYGVKTEEERRQEEINKIFKANLEMPDVYDI